MAIGCSDLATAVPFSQQGVVTMQRTRIPVGHPCGVARRGRRGRPLRRLLRSLGPSGVGLALAGLPGAVPLRDSSHRKSESGRPMGWHSRRGSRVEWWVYAVLVILFFALFGRGEQEP